MTSIKMYYFTPISDITGKREELIVLTDNTNLKDLINVLIKQYGNAIRKYFYNSEKYEPKCLVLINQLYTTDTDKSLKDGDTVSLVPPLGGG